MNSTSVPVLSSASPSAQSADTDVDVPGLEHQGGMTRRRHATRRGLRVGLSILPGRADALKVHAMVRISYTSRSPRAGDVDARADVGEDPSPRSVKIRRTRPQSERPA